MNSTIDKQIFGPLTEDDSASGHLLEAAPWISALIETSPLAMAVISGLTTRIALANQRLADLYGMPMEQILNADPFSLALAVTHPDELAGEQKLFAELVAGTRRFYEIEKRYVRPDGTERWGRLTLAAVSADPIHTVSNSGVIRYIVVQVLDITDRKQMEETLRERSKELRHAQKIDGIGRLAAGIAHDFNNLLTVINGYAELIQFRLEQPTEVVSRDDLTTKVRSILEAANGAASLTRQLLAYGRQDQVSPRPVCVSNNVESSRQLLSRALGANIQLEANLSATGWVRADPGQLGQVVMNFLLNARDALPDGGKIVITTQDVEIADGADTSQGPGVGSWVMVSVSDTGQGMAPEVRARIFEPFFTTRHGRAGTQGTGLGLAVVQRVISESGGHIVVDTELGKGTTMSVYLPRIPQPDQSAAVVPPAVESAFIPNERRILVVEDEPSVRSLIGTVLLGAHYRVAAARSADEAFARVQEEGAPFDLIITDVLMPGIGGVALMEQLRSSGHATRALFISGYNQHTEAELSRFGALLTKPFTPSQLLDTVAKALSDAN